MIRSYDTLKITIYLDNRRDNIIGLLFIKWLLVCLLLLLLVFLLLSKC